VTYLGLGMLEWSSWWLRQDSEARDAHRQGLEVYKRVQGCPIDDWFVAREVDVAFLHGDFEEAMRLARSTVARCRESGCLAGEAFAERMWGRALGAQRQYGEAEAHLRESIRAAELGGGRLLMARTYLAWAELCRQRGDAAAAGEHARIAAVLGAPA
jgi:tetratricopeptide (TPR) repeat protein